MNRADEALALFDISGAEAALIRHNENEIYRVRTAGRSYALRIHKCSPGFEPMSIAAAPQMEQREAELRALILLRESGMAVQRPVLSAGGGLVAALEDGTPVTLLEWIEGESMDALWHDGDIPEAAALAAGETAALISTYLAALPAKLRAARPAYGPGMLSALKKRMREAAASGALTKSNEKTILAAIAAMRDRMAEAERDGVSIVHADISLGNLIWNGTDAIPVDFSLAGIASPYADLASILANITRENARRAVIEGWERASGKRAELRLAEPYFALFIILFIACRYQNHKEWTWFPEAVERWCMDTFSLLARGEAFLMK